MNNMHNSKFDSYLDINSEVQNAIDNREPIVALESTIICHGMPFPKNLETAIEVESVVRENGGIPATIAILDGRLKVGISNEEMQFLAEKGKNIKKVSRRDIPFCLANKDHGATTVAATMIISSLLTEYCFPPVLITAVIFFLSYKFLYFFSLKNDCEKAILH